MISSVASASVTQAVVPSTSTSKAAPQPKASAASVPTDTVKISSAASKMMQEATESAAQTAKEAGAGDVQAQKLLAKEAEARK